MRKNLLKKAKQRIGEKTSEADIQIIKSINLQEDLENVFNLLSEQLIEWYGYSFPELRQSIRDNELLLKVSQLGSKKNLDSKKLLETASKETIEKILEKAKNSFGGEFKKEEYEIISEFSTSLLALKGLEKKNSSFIEQKVKDYAPNMNEICGAMLAAKLIAKANGLKKLAFLPSSTIQLLGAEKALFRHLKSGAKPPKHGIILQHQLVKSASKQEKGKAARRLAAKISIAAKKDYFKKTQ